MSETSDTIEALNEIVEGDWEESAPLAGPPTRWSLQERRADANILISLDFMPIKNVLNATFEVNGGDFSFNGETSIEGYQPEEALEQLIERFETHCVDLFGA